MITLHAFGNMFPGGIGETKDMRVQWALEEMGLPYQVRAWDYLAGDTNGPEFTALNPFNQLPVLEHDGRVLTESAAILIHLAETSGRLIPADAAGRDHVIQWCFAAVATVAPTLSMVSMYDAGFMGQDPAARNFLAGITHRWLGGLERRFANEGKPREWIAADEFTIADIVLAGVLREARDNELMDDYPHVRAFHARAHARPAWARTRELYAERLGVDAATID
jgi:glutathione S-transferase